jgi:ribosomal protein S13
MDHQLIAWGVILSIIAFYRLVEYIGLSRAVLIYMLGIMIVASVFPPFLFKNQNGVVLERTWGLLFDPPKYANQVGMTLDMAILSVELMIVGLISAAVFMVIRSVESANKKRLLGRIQKVLGVGIRADTVSEELQQDVLELIKDLPDTRLDSIRRSINDRKVALTDHEARVAQSLRDIYDLITDQGRLSPGKGGR